MRIVSLTCSNTEIVCALGCSEFLVGIDDHSDYPENIVPNIARVGPDLNVDINKIAALKPDLVLASLTVPGHEHNIEMLEKSGLSFYVTEPFSLEDVYQNIRYIAKLMGVSERAESIIDQMKPETALETDKPIILIQWWPKPVISPGKLSWVNDLIQLAGGINPLASEELTSRPLTDEEVAAINPDIIVLSWCGVKIDKYRPDVVYRNPVFSGVKAIKNRQIYNISEAFLGRPSPRLMEGLVALREIINQFKSNSESQTAIH